MHVITHKLLKSTEKVHVIEISYLFHYSLPLFSSSLCAGSNGKNSVPIADAMIGLSNDLVPMLFPCAVRNIVSQVDHTHHIVP